MAIVPISNTTPDLTETKSVVPITCEMNTAGVDSLLSSRVIATDPYPSLSDLIQLANKIYSDMELIRRGIGRQDLKVVPRQATVACPMNGCFYSLSGNGREKLLLALGSWNPNIHEPGDFVSWLLRIVDEDVKISELTVDDPLNVAPQCKG